jgi:hypothetical protein
LAVDKLLLWPCLISLTYGGIEFWIVATINVTTVVKSIILIVVIRKHGFLQSKIDFCHKSSISKLIMFNLFNIAYYMTCRASFFLDENHVAHYCNNEIKNFQSYLLSCLLKF